MSAAEPSSARPLEPFRPDQITRPDRVLLTYYVICSLASGPLLPFVLIPLVCKYVTLRYKFDEEGIAVSWGVLFRREVYLTYRRIQDIHLNRNIVQRWLGLATVSVQTASGNATPETTIEGVLEAEALRDFLYAKMRGARDEEPQKVDLNDQALALLTEIRDSLARIAPSAGRMS